MAQQAIGMIECKGLCALMEACDAALKAVAEVRAVVGDEVPIAADHCFAIDIPPAFRHHTVWFDPPERSRLVKYTYLVA